MSDSIKQRRYRAAIERIYRDYYAKVWERTEGMDINTPGYSDLQLQLWEEAESELIAAHNEHHAA